MSTRRSHAWRRSATGREGTSGRGPRSFQVAGREKRHHLYVSPTRSAELQAQVAFRDRLRADPTVAREYVALKRELAARHRDDRNAYTEAKTEFIEATLGLD